MEYKAATISTSSSTKKTAITFDPKRYIGAILSNWYWILLCIVLGIIGAFIYLQFAVPLYSINSSVVINDDANPSSDLLDKLNIVKKTPINFINEMNALHSEEMVEQAVDSLNMNIHYVVKGKFRDYELYKQSPITVVFDSLGYQGGFTEFTVNYTSDGHFEMKENGRKMDIVSGTWISRPYGNFRIDYSENASSPNKYLLKKIIVRITTPANEARNVYNNYKVISTDGRSNVLDLLYKDNVRERGIDFLNTIINLYYAEKLKNIDQSAQKTRDFINQHKSDLMHNLESIDSTVDKIKAGAGVVDVQTQTSTIVSQKNDIDKNIDDLLAKRRALLNLRYLLMNSRYQIIVPLDINDNILIGLINQYNGLVQKLETQEKVQELGASNPFLVETIVELEALKRRMLDVLSRISNTVDTDLQIATKTEQTYTQQIKSVPDIDRRITEVKRGYDVLQNMYLFLYQKGIEQEISVYNESNQARTVVAPYASTVPISPIRSNVYMAGILIGAIIPLILLLIQQLLLKKIVNEADIKMLTDIPIIGVISNVEPEKLRNNYIAISSSVRTGISEQFRMLRTNLEFVHFTENRKVISVTSSDSGEGKTFISLNLGLILALGTKRVIVVEFDLRKPKISEFLKIKDTNGVSEYLTGKIDLKDLIKPSGINSNLYIANCGQAPPNPGDLLAYPSTYKLIEELQEMFDIIILDTPPIGLVSDALVLSKYAGLNLFVIRQAVTTKRQVHEFDSLHKAGKMHNPAIIFNGVDYFKQYGYYYNPNKDYEQKLAEYASAYGKRSILSFFKK